MRARIWRKLHSEEAKRFDEAYALMAKHPELPLPEAFGLLQSGLSLEAFQARRQRSQKKQEVKDARRAVDAAPVDAFLTQLRDEASELAVVLGERTLLDVLKEVKPVAFTLDRAGRVEKLNVVLVTRRAAWEQMSPSLLRDPKLAQKPLPVAREPERRPYSDPRAFVSAVGKTVELLLRNGITLSGPLTAVGPFDLLLEVAGATVFIPIHGLLRWATQTE
jgi:hypothetical protein